MKSFLIAATLLLGVPAMAQDMTQPPAAAADPASTMPADPAAPAADPAMPADPAAAAPVDPAMAPPAADPAAPPMAADPAAAPMAAPAAMTPMAATKDYPRCSRTVTDSCISAPVTKRRARR